MTDNPQSPDAPVLKRHRKRSALTSRAVSRHTLLRLIAAVRKAKPLQPLHRLYGPVKYGYVLPAYKAVKDWVRGEAVDSVSAYRRWAAGCERLRYNREAAAERLAGFAYRPTISILMPVFNTPGEYLRKAVDSVRSQYYEDWELCICDDASTQAQVGDALRRYAERDERIKIVFSEKNGGIAVASNRALELATGEFIGLLDHDDELTPDALLEIAATLQEYDADVIYSDEDRINAREERAEPSFKPAWSPDLLLSCMYLAHFCVYRKSLIEAVKGFREGFEGSQDYDLALRCTEKTARIAHIPKILYHWRRLPTSASAPSRARAAVTDAGRRALVEALARRNEAGEVECGMHYGFYRVRRKLAAAGRVSILIPTRDGLSHLRPCLESIEAMTSYRNY